MFVDVVLGSVSGVLEGWSGCGGRLLLFCVCSCCCCWLLLRMIVEGFWHIRKRRDFFWSSGFVFLWFLWAYFWGCWVCFFESLKVMWLFWCFEEIADCLGKETVLV